MKLLTDKIIEALPSLYSTEDIPCDEKVVIVKFFNPMGNQTWEIFEGSPEGDDWKLFGNCDLGFGCAEWGYVMLSELEAIQLPMGLGIERDILVGPSEWHPEWANM